MILVIETYKLYADTSLGYLWQADAKGFPGEIGLGPTEADAIEALFTSIGKITEH